MDIHTDYSEDAASRGNLNRRENGRGGRCSLLGLALVILLLELLVLLLDLLEVGHVLLVVGASLEGDEQFGFLALSSLALHHDGLGLDLLELSVLVSGRASSKLK